MISPYLEYPLRPKHVVIADILANMRDSFIVVDMVRGEPYLRETDLGQTLERVVKDIIEGQYDLKSCGRWEAPVAVLRISRDAPAENVTGKVADAIIQYLAGHPDETYDSEGYLKPRPFLDNVRPDWESELPRGKGRTDPPDYEPGEAA